MGGASEVRRWTKLPGSGVPLPSAPRTADRERANGRADASVELRNVTKLFGAIRAVDNMSLELRPGEFFSLLGPSGCGKTTTLRMIGGFERPTAGEILLAGQDVTYLSPNRRDVNTVFQSYALFPHLTVRGNIAYGLRRKRVKAEEVDRRVNEMLALVDLEGMGSRKPSQLSGGQQQRVALARALVNHPRVLLLDEPMGALDAKLRKHMQVELKRIQKDVGLTFVYVTHDQEEALSMSDRIAVMRSGRIEGLGPPRSLYDDPTTEFVASFLGASNLLVAEVARADGRGCEIRVPGASEPVRISAARAQVRSVGSRVYVGIRPEKLLLARPEEPVDPGMNMLPVTVAVITYLGVGFQYSAVLPTGETVVVHEQDRGQRAVSAGEHAHVAWRPEHTFVVPMLDPTEAGRQAASRDAE